MAVNQQLLEQLRQQAAQQTPSAPQKQAGGLSNFLPAAGSIAGPVIGAILAPETFGASLIPGILASAAGGSIGEAAKEKIQGQKLQAGEIAKQGAIGGTGQLIGGAIGGLLGKLGGVAGEGASAIEKSVVNPKVAASITGSSMEDTITKTAVDRLGGGSAASMYSNLQPAMDKLEGEISQQLAQDNPVLMKGEIVSGLVDGITSSSGYVEGDKAASSVANELLNKIDQQLPENPTVGDLLKFKRDLGNNKSVASAFDALDRGVALNTKQQIYHDAWQSLDQILADKAANIKNLTQQESFLYRSAPGLKSGRNPLSTSILGTKVSVPAGIIQRPLMVGAKAIGQSGSALTKASPLLGSILGQGAVRLGTSGTQQSSAPFSGQSQPLSNQMNLGNATQDINSMLPSNMTSSPAFQEVQKTQDINRQFAQAILVDSIYNKGKNRLALEAAQKLMLQSQPKLSAAQKTSLEGITNAEAHLNVLESQLESIGLGTGPSARVTGEVKNLMGAVGYNPNAQAYNKAREVLALSLARALSGSARGNVQVIKLALNAIPKLTDTEEEKNIGFARLRQYLTLAKQNVYSATTAGDQSSSDAAAQAVQDQLDSNSSSTDTSF